MSDTDIKALIERLRSASLALPASRECGLAGNACDEAIATITRLEAERDAALTEATCLAGAYWRLDRLGAIGVLDEEFESECEQLRGIASRSVLAIRAAAQGKP